MRSSEVVGGETVSVPVEASGRAVVVVPVTSSSREAVYVSRFEVEDSSAPDFVVTDLRVGRDSQFVSVTWLPAEVFSARSTVELDFDPLVAEAVSQVEKTPGARVVSYVADPYRASGAYFRVDVLNLTLRTKTFRARVEWSRADRFKLEKARSLVRRAVGLGREDLLLGPGEWVEVRVQPCFGGVLERLVVPSSVAGAFRVVDVKVRPPGTSLLTSVGSPDAAFFNETSLNSFPRESAVGVSDYVAVVVENASREGRLLTGALVGRFEAGRSFPIEESE